MIVHKTNSKTQKKALTGIPFLKISTVKHGFKKTLPADRTDPCKNIDATSVWKKYHWYG